MRARKSLEKKNIGIFNVGNDDSVSVIDIAQIILSEMQIKNCKLLFKPATIDGRGWKGDMKNMVLDYSNLKRQEWKIKMSSKEAVRATVKLLLNEIY